MAEPFHHRIWIDRGGTFTDCVLWEPGTGAARAVKVLSTDRAPIDGIRALLGIPAPLPLPPCAIRMGTTLATNALLERKGARTVLVTDRGLGDVLRIGYQNRRELFALRIDTPSVLFERVVEVDGRLDASGAPLSRLDRDALARELRDALASGIESVAVARIHAHLDGAGEREVAEVARAVGFRQVSLSHEVAPEEGLVGRGDTTVADAYLTPVLRRYVDTLLAELPGSRIDVMQSSGGLRDGRRFRGRDAILSGPAGGVVAVARVAEQVGRRAVVGFDMGGTSTDVCRYAGSLERTYETEVAGVRFRAPMIHLHTVAAGGGSLCRLDGSRFVVGPESAGARPGPLCYGDDAATEVALTDVAVALGRVQPFHFPFPLDVARSIAGLERVRAELRSKGVDWSLDAVAEGFLRVAVENMAAAIREVSVARGHDVRDHAMVVFGGAGGQYAGAVARRLGIRELYFHPLAGVLSAMGIGAAPSSAHAEADLGRVPLESLGDAGAVFARLEAAARAELVADGCDPAAITTERRIDLRYRGTQTALGVDAEPGDEASLRARFEEAHATRFGYARPGFPIEACTARVEASARSDVGEVRELPAPDVSAPRTASMVVEGVRVEVPVFARRALAVGAPVDGPALVLDDTGTLVVEPGFSIVRRDDGVLAMTDARGLADEARGGDDAVADPVLLEVFNNLFVSVGEQMGHVLRRTAQSTNIRDRFDFSCAVFDAEGGLVANAPHIPVHLGAMSESVRAVIRAHPAPRPGDAFVTNDPARGGSHLPDITVVSPVHGPDGALRFYVASRGHHADVGGVTPGSMPPFSTTLEEEGVVLRGERIVHRGVFDEARLRALLAGARYPARRPDENVADVEAHLAANQLGARLLDELSARYGFDRVRAYMGHVQANAGEAVREAIRALPDGTRAFEDQLDDGTRIAVRVHVHGDAMTVDFTGTAAATRTNSNAPRAVTVAALLYVLRTMVGRAIPLNAGCLAPVRLVVPEGSLLDPPPDRAVAAGNVETSQRVVDVLLGALGLAAASQGTMNNVTFGDATFGYYETIAGGAGALPDAGGASGVHTHMTNSRITDPEVLEARFPVRLRTFAIRRGSGGEGRHRGGDGLVREIELLAPLEVSVLSERRATRPFGLEGGEAGAAGRNLLDGRELPGRASAHAPAGAVLRIETPGGGGYGEPGRA